VIPSLLIVEPPVGLDGSFSLDFGRVMTNRTACRQLMIRNNGSIPSSARLDIPSGSPFTVSDGAALFRVQPGTSQSLSVTYCPPKEGEHKAEASLQVAQNPYEASCVKLFAQCFHADVTIEDLPGGETDIVRLPECVVGEQQQCTFTLTNHGSKHFRVSWLSHPSITISPPVLHLHAATKRTCVLTFSSSAPAALSPAELIATVTEITYNSGEPMEWCQGSPENLSASADMPEPLVEPVKGSDKKLPLKVFAKADHIRFECRTDSIVFKATPMFQTRVFEFPLKNTCTVKFEMTGEIRHLDGTLDTSGLYELCPACAGVEAGRELKMVARFKPFEVQDCRRLAVLKVHGLSEDSEPPSIQLNGKVQRPWCHFEVLPLHF
jgi:hypothetical protein